VFEVLVNAVRCCSLGQISNALFEVGAVPEEYVVSTLRFWIGVKYCPPEESRFGYDW
jgi:hypothetical protein